MAPGWTGGCQTRQSATSIRQIGPSHRAWPRSLIRTIFVGLRHNFHRHDLGITLMFEATGPGGAVLDLKDFARRTTAPLFYGDRFAAIPQRLHSKWPERKFVRQFLKRMKIDCVWDIGANEGQFASELRVLGYKGLIFSFEPDPATFEKLAARAERDAKWLPFNKALGRERGTLDLNVMAFPVYNSFLKPSSAETSLHARANSVVRTVAVEVDTVGRLYSELAATHGFRRPHLKMDTQGFDLEVFAGGKVVWDRFVCLQSEVAVKRIYDGSPHWRDALAVYEEAGFELAGMFDVNATATPLIEMNCYMQKIEHPL